MNGMEFLAIFVAQFEALAEVIREGMRYGFTPGLGANFAQIRSGMVKNYRAVRPMLASYTQQSENRLDRGWSASRDPLEQLLSRVSLESLLRMDSIQLEKLLNHCERAFEELRPLATS